MNRRNFLRSLIAAIALAPVVARFRMEEVPIKYGPADLMTELLNRESGIMAKAIYDNLSKTSPWGEAVFRNGLGNVVSASQSS